MITIKNIGNQPEELIFSCAGGFTHHFLPPKQSVTVPSSFITEIVKELARRQILSLRNIG